MAGYNGVSFVASNFFKTRKYANARVALKTALLLATALSTSACMSDSIAQLSRTTTAPVPTTDRVQTAAVVTPMPPPAPSRETTGSIASFRAAKPVSNSAWEVAYAKYNRQASAYWDNIANKRKIRNQKRRNGQAITLNDYVLTQPPVYNGPPRPAMPPQKQQPSKPRAAIPGTADFLAAAKSVYGFTPERPRNEEEFMRAYAIAASQANLTRQQLVALYAFETGGDGTHDLQAGMLKDRKDARPISTAIGYNQLVATASVSVMSEFGNTIAAEIRKQAQTATGSNRQRLLNKANVVAKMTARAKSVPHRWSAQAALAKTSAGLGIHAMTLDKDVGPLLQTHKLRTSMHYLKAKGITRQLTGAELEMLNLTGDGNGFDMVTMPIAFRDKVPTANFFLRIGYERNPVAKHNNTVAQLLNATDAKMQANMQKEGAKALHRAFQSAEIAKQ